MVLRSSPREAVTEKPIADYMNHFLATTGVVPVGYVVATMSLIKGYDFPRDIRERAFTLGEKLVTAWKNKVTVPEYGCVTSEFRGPYAGLNAMATGGMAL